jgi:signal recognition particle receptor subunit beta
MTDPSPGSAASPPHGQIFTPASDAADRPPPVPVKIVVGGGFGAGKTTAIGTLSEIEPVVTEAAMTIRSADIDVAPRGSRKTATTVAMDFGRLTVDDSLVLYLFGTPGQERFGFMWPELCAGALGGIVMVDSSRIADCFVAIDYFEKIRLPFVVAVNQFDGRDNLPLDDVRAATNVDPDIPVVGVDARSHDSMKGAALRLLDLILARARR